MTAGQVQEQAGTRWDELSEPVKAILGWALAIEQRSFAGTRTLLAGIVRSEPPDNPVDTLLRHFDVSREAFFDALVRAGGSRIFAQTSKPLELHELPDVTENARAALAEGMALQRRTGEGALLTVPYLFAGLLVNPRATASVGLARALGVEAPTIRSNYLLYLMGTSGAPSYAAHLQATLPRGVRPGPSPADRSSDPWSALVVLSTDGDLRLGLRTTPTTVLTAAFAPVEDVWAWAASAAPSTQVSFRVAVARDEAILFRRESPPQAEPAGAPVRLGSLQFGQRCEYACVNQSSAKVTRRAGVIRQIGQPAEPRFAIEDLAEPTSDVAIGSPVIVEGAVVGMVESAPPGMLRCFSVAATDLFADDGLARVMVGSLGGAGSDAVGEKDQLGFEHYVHAFAELICSEHTKPPLTIGIFGSWGSGKSFLLRHVEREIVKRQEQGNPALEVHTVRFNAWEYSATEVMWPGLVRKILNTVDADVPYRWYRKWWLRIRRNWPREMRRVRWQLIAFALLLIGAVVATEVLSNSGLATVIGLVAAAGVGIGGVVKAATKPFAQWLGGVFADADYGRQIGYMEEIRGDLEALEARLHGDKNPVGGVERRVLVLIDDLDRCEPAKAVEVLQAVNLLLDFPSFVVCLGIDARVVTSAIEAHYEGLLGRAGASGYEYLDKIVQIPFMIPTPGEAELKVYVGEQLGDEAEVRAPGVRVDADPPARAAAALPAAGEPGPSSSLPPAGPELPRTPLGPSSEPFPGVHFTAAERAAFEALVVLPTEVVNAADGWLVADPGVWSARVVVLEPVWQGLVAVGV